MMLYIVTVRLSPHQLSSAALRFKGSKKLHTRIDASILAVYLIDL